MINKTSYFFVGFVLIFFNINIGQYDILPDFIGYSLVLIGLISLAKLNKIYTYAFAPTIFMAIVSFFTYFIPFINPILPFEINKIIMNLVILFCILTGFMVNARDIEDFALSDDINNKRYSFIILYCAFYLFVYILAKYENTLIRYLLECLIMIMLIINLKSFSDLLKHRYSLVLNKSKDIAIGLKAEEKHN